MGTASRQELDRTVCAQVSERPKLENEVSGSEPENDTRVGSVRGSLISNRPRDILARDGVYCLGLGGRPAQPAIAIESRVGGTEQRLGVDALVASYAAACERTKRAVDRAGFTRTRSLLRLDGVARVLHPPPSRSWNPIAAPARPPFPPSRLLLVPCLLARS